MKIAVLCLCLFTIAFAHPIKKAKFHDDDSVSLEEKHNFKGHHVHKHHHRHHHSHSHSQEHSQEHSPEHVNSHESQEHPSSSRLSSDSQESEEITEQQTLLVPSGKIKEDDHSHSDMDDHDDLDDHDDVDDSDESHESDESDQVTEAPTDDPLTPSAAPDPFTGRGDSPYGIQGGQRMFLKKSIKSSEKFDSHDSSQVASSESQDTSIEGKSKLQDSHEVLGASHHKSVEDDSRQKLYSVEDNHDDSKSDISLESSETDHSSEQLKARRQEPQEVDHDHDVDNVGNQSVESFDDHHSVENNEIEY